MTQNPAVSEPVERRTIEHVPVDERHGRARDLFTVWFGSNIMLLTIITGALATTVFALPLWAGALAIVLGNVIGGVVMALHAAQGPQMGVPQMLQTRAQFGSYGSLLVVVLVIFMYLGFFASNAVLGGQALAKVTGMPTNWAITIIGLISVVATIIGYRLIHRVTAVLSVVAGGALLVAFVWMVVVNGVPEATWHGDGFTWAGFMASLSVAALWQIAYAPYVSDYTRYMPKDTGRRAAFWGTYTGCLFGSVLPMLLGVLVGAALPTSETLEGLSELTRGVSTGLFAIFALGISKKVDGILQVGPIVLHAFQDQGVIEDPVGEELVYAAVMTNALHGIVLAPAHHGPQNGIHQSAEYAALVFDLCGTIGRE